MPQLLEVQREWWRRSFGTHSARTVTEPSSSSGAPAPPDSPLARARMAAQAARLAEQLDLLERGAAAPEVIAAQRSELITLRARLCRAASDAVHNDAVRENVH